MAQLLLTYVFMIRKLIFCTLVMITSSSAFATQPAPTGNAPNSRLTEIRERLRTAQDVKTQGRLKLRTDITDSLSKINSKMAEIKNLINMENYRLQFACGNGRLPLPKQLIYKTPKMRLEQFVKNYQNQISKSHERNIVYHAEEQIENEVEPSPIGSLYEVPNTPQEMQITLALEKARAEIQAFLTYLDQEIEFYKTGDFEEVAEYLGFDLPKSFKSRLTAAAELDRLRSIFLMDISGVVTQQIEAVEKEWLSIINSPHLSEYEKLVGLYAKVTASQKIHEKSPSQYFDIRKSLSKNISLILKLPGLPVPEKHLEAEYQCHLAVSKLKQVTRNDYYKMIEDGYHLDDRLDKIAQTIADLSTNDHFAKKSLNEVLENMKSIKMQQYDDDDVSYEILAVKSGVQTPYLSKYVIKIEDFLKVLKSNPPHLKDLLSIFLKEMRQAGLADLEEISSNKTKKLEKSFNQGSNSESEENALLELPVDHSEDERLSRSPIEVGSPKSSDSEEKSPFESPTPPSDTSSAEEDQKTPFFSQTNKQPLASKRVSKSSMRLQRKEEQLSKDLEKHRKRLKARSVFRDDKDAANEVDEKRGGTQTSTSEKSLALLRSLWMNLGDQKDFFRAIFKQGMSKVKLRIPEIRSLIETLRGHLIPNSSPGHLRIELPNTYSDYDESMLNLILDESVDVNDFGKLAKTGGGMFIEHKRNQPRGATRAKRNIQLLRNAFKTAGITPERFALAFKNSPELFDY